MIKALALKTDSDYKETIDVANPVLILKVKQSIFVDRHPKNRNKYLDISAMLQQLSSAH